jgi:hypothetical protein
MSPARLSAYRLQDWQQHRQRLPINTDKKIFSSSSWVPSRDEEDSEQNDEYKKLSFDSRHLDMSARKRAFILQSTQQM